MALVLGKVRLRASGRMWEGGIGIVIKAKWLRQGKGRLRGRLRTPV